MCELNDSALAEERWKTFKFSIRHCLMPICRTIQQYTLDLVALMPRWNSFIDKKSAFVYAGFAMGNGHVIAWACICLLFTERIFNENGSFAQRIYSSTTTTTTTKITRSATNLFSCVTNLTDSFPEFNFHFIKCSADDVVDTPTENEFRFCVNMCRVFAQWLWEGQRWVGAIRNNRFLSFGGVRVHSTECRCK